MADNNISNDKDTMDINELASLNDDISPELIEQLQAKISKEFLDKSDEGSAGKKQDFNAGDDTTLFEEPTGALSDTADASSRSEEASIQKKEVKVAKKFDDNFIKKYKAKLNKQMESENKDKKSVAEDSISNVAFSDNTTEAIEQISNGNISEHAITKEQKSYNDSLDFLDGNVKYSKYVIYIDPQNVDYIESLTVKERKNVINSLLREQDDIAITKHRFRIINAVIRHVIVAVLTLTISIPVIYWTINASLEATINNYRRSQSMFQVLYKDKGRITQTNNR